MIFIVKMISFNDVIESSNDSQDITRRAADIFVEANEKSHSENQTTVEKKQKKNT